ncbi:MAG: hypothetical protein HY332_09405 [Chloroflexi bacterium]|nr:hypothetical protein [Chloroflexota bacterium]
MAESKKTENVGRADELETLIAQTEARVVARADELRNLLRRLGGLYELQGGRWVDGALRSVARYLIEHKYAAVWLAIYRDLGAAHGLYQPGQFRIDEAWEFAYGPAWRRRYPHLARVRLNQADQPNQQDPPDAAAA